MKIAVVTGASSGMGRDFVTALDINDTYDEIWVIARREEKLRELCGQTRATIRVTALDLTDESALKTYAEMLADIKPEVAVLVNAAGFGKFNYFTDVPLPAYESMVELNVKALMSMTYLTLPYMRAGAEIYMLGSMSAFQPVPYINIYGATKAFVVSFSRALNRELKQRGIKVMAVCPLWVKTEFFDTAVSDDSVTYYNSYCESADVVRQAVNDMRRGKDVSVYGLTAKFQRFMCKLLPHRLIMEIWMKQQKHS